jgi:hypothetical protein
LGREKKKIFLRIEITRRKLEGTERTENLIEYQFFGVLKNQRFRIIKKSDKKRFSYGDETKIGFGNLFYLHPGTRQSGLIKLTA